MLSCRAKKKKKERKKVSRTARSFVILYTDNELLEREIKKIIPFIIAFPTPNSAKKIEI